MGDLHKKIIVFLAIMALGYNAIIIKECTLDSAILMFYRLSFSATFFGLFMLISDRGKSIVKMDRKDLGFTLLVGMLFAMQAILYVYAIRNTSIANALIIINSSSVFVVLISRFVLREKISNIAVGASLLAFIGCVIMSVGPSGIGEGALFGDLCAWAGAIAFALYLLGAKKRSVTAPFYVNMFLMGIGGLIFIVALCLVRGLPLIGYPLEQLGLALASAFAGIIIPHGTSNWAMKTVSSAFIAVVFLVEPIAGTIFAYFILNQVLGLSQMIGGIMVITGLVCYNIYENKRASVEKGIESNR